jgi:hypothetical protein
MRLHEVLTRFSDIIRSDEVVQYEIANLNSRLKLEIVVASGRSHSTLRRDIIAVRVRKEG